MVMLLLLAVLLLLAIQVLGFLALQFLPTQIQLLPTKALFRQRILAAVAQTLLDLMAAGMPLFT